MSRIEPRISVVASMVSGLETFVKREVEALRDRGYAIQLLVTKFRRSAGFEPREDIPYFRATPGAALAGLGFLLFRHPMRLLNMLADGIRHGAAPETALAVCWVRRVLQFGSDGIYCVFGDRKFFVGYFLHRLTGLPLSVAVHAHEIYAQPNQGLFRKALHAAKAIITISETNKRILIEDYGAPAQRVHVIRLSVDTDFWSPDRPIVVLTAARFTPRKGWDDLFAAAAILGPKYHFVGVGFGDLDVGRMARDSGVADHVTMFAKLHPSQLRVLMRAADVFCLPSKFVAGEGSEGIPVVLMEAMAVGLPVVTTNDGSIEELVSEFVVPAGDPVALAEALKTATVGRCGPDPPVVANRQQVARLHGPSNLDQLDRVLRGALS